MIWLAVIGKFLRGVPWQVWALAGLLAAGWWYGHWRFNAGRADTQAQWDAAVELGKAELVKLAENQTEVTKVVETRYIDRIKIVREKGATVVKEVTRYVPSTACPLPGGFRVYHDAAAQGEVPNTAGITDAAPVPATDAAATIAGNYFTCHETAERLTGLQEWVTKQAELNR